MILGLFNQVVTGYGLERVNRHTTVVLARLARERAMPYRILSVNDAAGEHEVQVGDEVVRVRGFAGRRGRFVLAALALAARVRWLYIGHVALAPIALAMRLRRPSIRYWIAIHGIEVWTRLALPWRLGLRRATGINAVSRYTAERAHDVQGVDMRRIRVLPNALDPEWSFDARHSNGDGRATSNHLTLLTVARLSSAERYKGVDTVIQALPHVRRTVPAARYVVIGSGDDRARLEALAAQEQVREHVSFLGRVSDEELRRQLEACDVFVMPSRGEGFGVAYLEAMAVGKPVIAGAHGGAPEVVADGATGFLVTHGDVDALAARVVQLLQDVDLRRRMGCAGRARVVERFTFPRFCETLTGILRASTAGE